VWTDRPQKRSFCHAPTPEAAARVVLDAMKPVLFKIERIEDGDGTDGFHPAQPKPSE